MERFFLFLEEINGLSDRILKYYNDDKDFYTACTLVEALTRSLFYKKVEAANSILFRELLLETYDDLYRFQMYIGHMASLLDDHHEITGDALQNIIEEFGFEREIRLPPFNEKEDDPGDMFNPFGH